MDAAGRMNPAPDLRLLLIRHGETDWSREGRFCGRSDPPLNECGLAQASALAKRLESEGITAGYTSPAQRAVQTAEIIGTHLGLSFTMHSELQEQNFGEWEGGLPQAIAERDPVTWIAWQSGERAAPPGGESLATVVDRIGIWLGEVAQAKPRHTIAAVAHGGVLQVGLCVLLGTPLRPLWPYRLAPGSVAEVWLYPMGAVLVGMG